MTKEQMSNFLRGHGVNVVGYKTKDGYIVTQIGDEKFLRHGQTKAHIALIHAFLAVVDGIHANDAAEQLEKVYHQKYDENEITEDNVGEFF